MKRLKALIADDSAIYRKSIQSALEGVDWIEVVAALPNGRLAIDRMADSLPDLLILDMEMPEMDGLQTLREIKQRGWVCSVLVFSSLSKRGAEITLEALNLGAKDFITKPQKESGGQSPVEKIRLLDLGADDYLAKPFDSQELLARVKALLRRDRVNLQFGNITLNSESRTINVDGQEFSLPNKEFVLLRTLLQIPGRVYSKGFLYQQVWDMKSDVESNVVETTVNKLRRRLTEAGARISIRNARSSGYWVEE